MIYSASRPACVALLALVMWLGTAACTGGDRSSSASESASAVAAGPPPVSDSVRVLTDSLMKIADASRVTGNSNAKVWLIVMSDFQCPACRLYYEGAYPRIKKEYLDRGLIRMAYVNFPRPYHAHASTTSERALCAGLQGKFWEYHDALFDSQEAWAKLPAGTPYFDSLAVKIKLDMSDMELCVSSGVMRTLVAADDMRSSQSGASATPTFLIGGVKVEGAQPFDVFKRHLDVSLAAARAGGGGN